uniref:RBBP8 N-terminal-like protein n=1 Tax=Pogona vitticeps TaxID=103695 RepID=A0A6J0USW0_9SAUR
MATESFAGFLDKLKEIHEKEVQGLQSKLNELTNEKCRDTQRIEELFAKNHQLREQQKLLKENVKVLENRLRAGLCDRCQVTQELAKKKQHEFGKAHFQSLQLIFILTNETNKLREENRNLKEELKRLCGTEDKPRSFKGPSREGSATPDSPLPLVSMRSRKSSPKKTAGNEAEDESAQSPEQRITSPCARISPNVLQGEHALELSSQRIANQLHGTIALLRSRSSSQESDGTGKATPPLASQTPPFPQTDQSTSFEDYFRASKSDRHEIASSYERLKLATRKEQLSLLNQHFALHHLGVRNNPNSKENSFLPHLLMPREVGGRRRSQDEWEDPAALLNLPGAVMYMKDHHLENRFHLLKHQEKLHSLLTEKQLQECKARTQESSDQTPQRSSPPPPRIAKECKKERVFLEESPHEMLGKLLSFHKEDLEQAEEAEAVRDYFTDAPLDLSDSGRGRGSMKAGNCPPTFRDYDVGSPCKGQKEESFLQKTCLPSWPQKKKHLHGSNESEQQLSPKETIVVSPVSLRPELPASHPISCNATTGSETKAPLGAEQKRSDQADDGDSESMKEESESDTSGSEMMGAYEDESHPGASMADKYCCQRAAIQRSQRKRRRGSDSGTEADSKSARRGQNGKATQDPADLQDSAKDMTSHSPAFRHSDNEET